MSFSSNVKKEIYEEKINSRHCNIAEFTAILNYSSKIDFSKFVIEFFSDNEIIYLKFKNLIKILFSFNLEEEKIETNNKKQKYFVTISDKKLVLDIFRTTQIENNKNILSLILRKDCCKREYVKIAFIVAGSVSEPEKSYHLEFINGDIQLAKSLSEIINSFGLNSKIISRKSSYIVYLKESEQIVDLLNIIGAHSSLMDYENIRIIKDVRNNTNRFVNCEAANLEKTVKASLIQCENILFIKKIKGFGFINKNLREIAEARLEFPDCTLKELGEKLNPAISKSGVNHRLKKINEIADNIRGGLL